MKCDGCDKEITHEAEVAVIFQISGLEQEDWHPKHTLGKYFGTKVNVNGVLTWTFCFECVLDKFIGKVSSLPGIGCGGCGAIGEGTPENLPPGWKIRRHRGGHDYRCPNCQKKPEAKEPPFVSNYSG